MYIRTDNGDGSFNSRCLHCLMTIASDIRSSKKMDRAEKKHICVEMALFELMKIQQNLVQMPQAFIPNQRAS